MPSIVNIANMSTENKLSSKSKFSIGEKFSGKLVKDSETGELKVRLREGIEISAEIEGDFKFIEKDKFIKFEIKGFENGKLKLKIVNSETNNLKKQDEEIEGFIKQQGLSKEDTDIVKSMIKHDMKLSREEILKVRTLFHFKEDIKGNKEEVDKFINSFLKSKGISKESQEGQKIIKALNNFFEKLAILKSDELLTILENNIEITDKSINSFLKLTKENGQTYKNLKEVLNIQDEQKDNPIIKQPSSKELEVKVKENKIEKNEKNQDTNKEILKNQSTINSNNIENPKLQDNMMKNLLKNVLLDKNSEGSLKDPIKVLSNLRVLTEEKIINNLENLCKKLNLPLSKIENSEIENSISSILGENVILKEEEIENIKTIFKDITGENGDIQEINLKKQTKMTTKNSNDFSNKEIEKNSVDRDVKFGENISKESLDSNSLKNFKTIKALSKEVVNLKNTSITIESQIKEKCLEIKSLVKEIVNKGENLGFNISKETISDLKVLNSLNNNYYMLDLPLKLNEREMECKLMIKDDRKSGKKIDSKNVKLVITIDTINMGKIDGYLKVLDKNLNIDLKCNEKWIKPILLGKDVLLESLNSMGYNANMSVTKQIEEANISNCREFFNDKTILVLDRMV